MRARVVQLIYARCLGYLVTKALMMKLEIYFTQGLNLLTQVLWHYRHSQSLVIRIRSALTVWAILQSPDLDHLLRHTVTAR